MPVLDLEDFLKRDSPKQPAVDSDSSAKPAQEAGPASVQKETFEKPAETGLQEDYLSLGRKTESLRLDLAQLKEKVARLEASAQAELKQAKAAQASASTTGPGMPLPDLDSLKARLASLDEFRKRQEEIQSKVLSDVNSLKSGAQKPGALADDAGSPPVGLELQKLGIETVGISARLKLLEVSFEEQKAAAGREKDILASLDQFARRMDSLEGKLSSKIEISPDQFISKSQFDKYSRMVDLDRQQIRQSIDGANESVAQLSATLERAQMAAKAAQRAGFLPAAIEPLQARVDYLEAKFADQSRQLETIIEKTGAEAIERYSKELEATRSEVASNYQQVKDVEKLLSGQSMKMQEIFGEIQKNLVEYRATSDVINSTHDAVLRDIASLKAEHERNIAEYHQLASGLSQKVAELSGEVARRKDGASLSSADSARLEQAASGLAMVTAKIAHLEKLEQELSLLPNFVSKAELDSTKAAVDVQISAAKAEVEKRVGEAEARIAAPREDWGAPSQLKADFEKLSAAFDSLSSKVSAVEGGRDALEGRVTKLGEMVRAASENPSAPADRLRAFEKELRRLSDEFEDSRSRRDDGKALNLGVSELSDKVSRLGAKAEESAKALSGRLESAEGALAGVARRQDEESANNASLFRSITSGYAALKESAEAQKASWESAKAELLSLASKPPHEAAGDVRQKAIESRVEELSGRVDSLQHLSEAELAKKEEELSELEKREADAIEQLRPSLERVEALQKKIEADRGEMEESIKGLKHRIIDLDAKLFAFYHKSRVMERQESLQAPAPDAAAPQQRPYGLESELSELEKAIVELEANLSSTSRELGGMAAEAEAVVKVVEPPEAQSTGKTQAADIEKEAKGNGQQVQKIGGVEVQESESPVGEVSAKQVAKEALVQAATTMAPPRKPSMLDIPPDESGVYARLSRQFRAQKAAQLKAMQDEQEAKLAPVEPQTSADRMAMDLMDELREKLLGDRTGAKTTSRGDAATGAPAGQTGGTNVAPEENAAEVPGTTGQATPTAEG
jgi:DNA repair exonuclease SbcCD ATPase subunit